MGHTVLSGNFDIDLNLPRWYTPIKEVKKFTSTGMEGYVMPIVNGLGGPAGFGENVLGRNDDGSSSFINLSSIFDNGLNFFGTTYTGLYINTNGSVSFERPVSAFTPTIISADTVPAIFPFWADVDTRGGQTTPSTGGVSQGTNRIYYDFDNVSETFTVTWDDVGYYPARKNLTNTFQLVLKDLSDVKGFDPGDFSISLLYEDIQWTTGSASGGTNGLGGKPARIGYSSGTGTGHSFELPSSGDQNALLALGDQSDVRFFSRGYGVILSPSAKDDVFQVDERGTVAGNLFSDNGNGVDSDPEEAPLSIVSVNGSTNNVGTVINIGGAGQLSVQNNGDFVFTAALENDLSLGASVLQAFEYTVSNGRATDQGTVQVTVNGVNVSPIASADTFETVENTTLNVDVGRLLSNDSDADGDLIPAISRIVSTENGTVVLSAGNVIFTPDTDFFGPASFVYEIADATGLTSTATASITVNEAPFGHDFEVVLPDNMRSGQVGLAQINYTGHADTSAPSAGDAMLVTVSIKGGLVADPVSGAFSNTVLIPVNMTAAGAFETIDLLVKATAGPRSTLIAETHFAHMDAEAEITTRVTINPAEGNGRSDGDPHLSTFDGVGYSFQAVGEFTLAIGDGFEIQTRQTAINDSVSVNSATVMNIGDNVVGIYAEENIPLVINGTAVVLAQGESIAVGDGSAYRGNFGRGDELGNFDVYVVTDGQGNGFWTNVYFDANHLRPFVATNDVAGLLGNLNGDRSDDFQLRDGTVLSQPLAETVLYGEFADSWRITQENSLFVYAEGETTETFTDRNFPTNIVTLDDLDPDARAAAEAVANANGLTPGTFEFETTVLDIVLTGSEDFAVGVGGAPEFQAEGEEVEIVEVEINEAPTAVQDTATVDEDGSVNIDVRANDTDPEGDTLTLVGGADPNGGTVTVVNGELRFAPAPNFNGDTTLSYDLTDAGANTVTGRVVVTVNAQPDVPVANDDGGADFTTDENTAQTTASVLINDSDADGDTLRVASISLAGTLGLVTNNGDGTFGYDPNGAFDRLNDGETATDTFSYTLSDGNGGTSVATVTLTITGISDDPIVGSDRGETLVGTDAAEELDAMGGDDVVDSGRGADTVTLGSGADALVGEPAAIFGDTLTDFSEEDRIVFKGVAFERSNVTVDSDPFTISVDTDQDGTADGSLTVPGNFSAGEFMVVTLEGDTTITFETFLPALQEGQAVDPDLVNGVINQVFLTGDGSSDFRVTRRDMGHTPSDNVVGAYEIDTSGNIVDAHILFENANTNRPATWGITDVEAGNRLGFFIVQDAADWAETLAYPGTLAYGDTLSFVNSSGAAANISDGSAISIAVNGTAVDEVVFHSFSKDLNSDGAEHVLSGVDVGGESITIGFEDLTGGGDRDYEDVVLQIAKVEEFIFTW
jgi:VCBS repeat-containing protein